MEATHHEGPTPIRATCQRGKKSRLPHPDITPQEACLLPGELKALRPWAMGIGLTVLVAVAAVPTGWASIAVERSPQRRGNTHCTLRPCRQHRASLMLGAAMQSAPTESSSASRVRGRHLHQTRTT